MHGLKTSCSFFFFSIAFGVNSIIYLTLDKINFQAFSHLPFCITAEKNNKCHSLKKVTKVFRVHLFNLDMTVGSRNHMHNATVIAITGAIQLVF